MFEDDTIERYFYTTGKNNILRIPPKVKDSKKSRGKTDGYCFSTSSFFIGVLVRSRSRGVCRRSRVVFQGGTVRERTEEWSTVGVGVRDEGLVWYRGKVELRKRVRPGVVDHVIEGTASKNCL